MVPSSPSAPAAPVQPPVAQQTTLPAAALPNWNSEWAPAFAALGVDQANIEKIASAPLTQEQLALTYMTIRQELATLAGKGSAPAAADPTSPTGATPPPGTGGWSPQWEQKFVALGLPAEAVAQIRQLAIENKTDDATLQQLHDKLQAEGAGKAGAQASAWSPEWEKKFTDLGMPKEMVAVYAGSGLTAAGLQAAYDYAKGRLDGVKKTGYYDKLLKAGVSPDQLWGVILAPKPATADQLRGMHEQMVSGKMPLWKKGAQLGITFFPGGELLQYAVGHKLITKKEIDRSNPLNMLAAGLSGLAAFTAMRGAGNVMRGWRAVGAIKAGTSPLTQVGLTTQGQSVSDAALGTLNNAGLRQKIFSFVPATSTHRQVIGWGHADAAARTFANGADDALLLAGRDGALSYATLSKLFDDIKLGNMKVVGSPNGYLGAMKLPFKMPKAPTELAGDATIVFKGSMKSSRGDQSLVGLLEAVGPKLTRDKQWLTDVFPSLSDDLAAITVQDGKALGQLMAGNATKAIGADKATGLNAVLGRLKPGPAQYYGRLAQRVAAPDWYANLANKSMLEFAAGPGRDRVADLLVRANASGIDVANGHLGDMAQAVVASTRSAGGAAATAGAARTGAAAAAAGASTAAAGSTAAARAGASSGATGASEAARGAEQLSLFDDGLPRQLDLFDQAPAATGAPVAP